MKNVYTYFSGSLFPFIIIILMIIVQFFFSSFRERKRRTCAICCHLLFVVFLFFVFDFLFSCRVCTIWRVEKWLLYFPALLWCIEHVYTIFFSAGVIHAGQPASNRNYYLQFFLFIQLLLLLFFSFVFVYIIILCKCCNFALHSFKVTCNFQDISLSLYVGRYI